MRENNQLSLRSPRLCGAQFWQTNKVVLGEIDGGRNDATVSPCLLVPSLLYLWSWGYQRIKQPTRLM
jgi:hypothetical protein